MTQITRILLTPGEPAGIGPDITIQLAQEPHAAELIAICDPTLLRSRAKQLNLPLTLSNVDLNQPATLNEPGTLKIMPLPLAAICHAGELNPANARYVLQCLDLAIDTCQQNLAQALVTGPIHKGILNDAGIPFTGHTEYLAKRCQSDHVIMLFVADNIKVALATTHLPLSAVPKAITKDLIQCTVRLLHTELQKHFAIPHPTLLVCGLNPHAGENGHLGREEIDIISPALHQLRHEKINVLGPLPADTIFTEKYFQNADAILAMYHDQALPVVKYLGFGQAVNVTLGLPIIRTSVDHGTALDIAGTGLSDAGSLHQAVQLAIQLTGQKK